MAYKKKKYTKPVAGSIPWNPAYPPTDEQQSSIKYTSAAVGALGSTNPLLQAINHSILIDAVAGSGKTTVLLHMLHGLPSTTKAILVVFSRVLANETLPKCPAWAQCSTKHALGLKILTTNKRGVRFEIQAGMYDYRKRKKTACKVTEILKGFAQFDPDLAGEDDKGEVYNRIRQAKKAISLIKAGMVDWNNPAELDAMFDHYTIQLDIQDDFYNMLPAIMERDLALSAQGIINFDDMYWLCIYWDLKFPEYDLVLADECQDFNLTDHLFLEKLQGKNAIVFVGDPMQSIIGFAGAMPDSVDQIRDKWNPKEFSLTYNFRCGRAVLDSVKHIVPHIQAWEGAPEGKVERSLQHEFDLNVLEPGSMVLCRRNAGLINDCFKMLRNGRHANIKGDDLSYGITRIHKKTHKKALKDHGGLANMDIYLGVLADLEDSEISTQMARKNPSKSIISLIEDRYETVRCVANNCEDPSKIPDAIDELFDPKTDAVLFSSMHRSKGLEAKQVVILDSNNMVINHPEMKDWEHHQEKCLSYVAMTRAKEELYLLRKKDEE